MNEIVGNNLKKLREANRFSQEQVASFLGINRSTYSNYESGDREAPLEVLEKASDLFGCELHLLFEENESVVDNMLVCAFRVDDLSASDMKEVASFKNIVKNYLKIKRLLA
jgi:transcriptional regulator with XRE-family HTH domain